MSVLSLVFLDPAYPDGRVANPAEPQLLVTDQGAARGDGIFETMMAVDGNPRGLQAHLDRLGHSAAAMDLTIPDHDAWRRALETALTLPEAVAPQRLVVKLIVTRGPEGTNSPTAWVQTGTVPAAGQRQREAGVRVLLLERGYDSGVSHRAPYLLQSAKTLSYAINMAALRYAHAHGADDAIFLSSDGRVLEGATSSVITATVHDGERHLRTPAPDGDILPGTTQSALFEAADSAGWSASAGPMTTDDLLAADGVWLVSSVRLLAPVISLDSRPVRTPRELTEELAGLLEGAGH